MTGIIAAMEEEVKILRESLKSRSQLHRGPLVFEKGLYKGQEVVVLKCGIGKVNAAMGTSLMIEIFKPRCLLHTGVAGGLLEEARQGDLVEAQEILHHDADVTAFGYLPGQLPGLPARFQADENLLNLARKAFEDLKARGELAPELGFHRGAIGSGDQFISDKTRVKSLAATFPGLAAVEMEGAAVAQVCYQMDIPFLVLRALSDKADGEAPLDFPQFVALAARNSARMILEILERLSQENSHGPK